VVAARIIAAKTAIAAAGGIKEVVFTCRKSFLVFSGHRKTQLAKSFVTGHEFTRAVSFAK
jgi:hypothetical protein